MYIFHIFQIFARFRFYFVCNGSYPTTCLFLAKVIFVLKSNSYSIWCFGVRFCSIFVYLKTIRYVAKWKREIKTRTIWPAHKCRVKNQLITSRKCVRVSRNDDICAKEDFYGQLHRALFRGFSTYLDHSCQCPTSQKADQWLLVGLTLLKGCSGAKVIFDIA